MTDEFTCDGIFDAKLIRENKSAKGIFLTLEIAADDYFAAKLSDVRPGALLRIGYQEMPDTSVHAIEAAFASLEDEPPNATAVPPKKDKRRFADLPASQQAAIRCEDENFHRFLEHYMPDTWGYSTNPDPDSRAVDIVRHICGVKSRADINEKNPTALERFHTLEARYQDWLADRNHSGSVRG